jgi:hypothetical protein
MERGPLNAWGRKTTRAQTLISVEEGFKSQRWREVFEADGWRTSSLPETGHRAEQHSGLHDTAVRSKRAIEEIRRSGGCQTRAGGRRTELCRRRRKRCSCYLSPLVDPAAMWFAHLLNA